MLKFKSSPANSSSPWIRSVNKRHGRVKKEKLFFPLIVVPDGIGFALLLSYLIAHHVADDVEPGGSHFFAGQQDVERRLQVLFAKAHKQFLFTKLVRRLSEMLFKLIFPPPDVHAKGFLQHQPHLFNIGFHKHLADVFGNLADAFGIAIKTPRAAVVRPPVIGSIFVPVPVPKSPHEAKIRFLVSWMLIFLVFLYLRHGAKYSSGYKRGYVRHLV